MQNILPLFKTVKLCRKIIIKYIYFFILFAKKTFKFLSPLLVTSCTSFYYHTYKTKENILSTKHISINMLNRTFPSAVTLFWINKSEQFLSGLGMNTLMLLAVFNILCKTDLCLQLPQNLPSWSTETMPVIRHGWSAIAQFWYTCDRGGASEEGSEQWRQICLYMSIY